MASTFSAGGLASGLDTNSIIDKLDALQRAPIDKLKKTQAAFDVQISSLGTYKSKLTKLDTATAALATSGARGIQVASTNTAFTATATSLSTPGRYAIEVQNLATAAKSRSQGFSSSAAPVAGGTMHIGVDGTAYDIEIADGATLQQAAAAINAGGAPVTASILNDGTNSYLSITRNETGFKIAGAPADALSISIGTSGSAGTDLAFSSVVTAANASLTIDGLPFERTSNEITDAIPGTMLRLNSKTSATSDLVLADDNKATQANLQKLVDAYNDVMKDVQSELNLKPDTDRSKTLAGDNSLRLIQQRLQGLMTKQVGTGAVRTLADLGVKTARDGTLSIDQATLEKAIKKDGTSVDAILKGPTGIAQGVKDLVRTLTSSVDGVLTTRQAGLKRNIEDIDKQVEVRTKRADLYRENLVKQFTAMEKIISGLNASGQFLTSQSNAEAAAAKG